MLHHLHRLHPLRLRWRACDKERHICFDQRQDGLQLIGQGGVVGQAKPSFWVSMPCHCSLVFGAIGVEYMP